MFQIKVFTFIVLVACSIAACDAGNVLGIDKDKGYYVDERNQIEKQAYKVDYKGSLEVQPSSTVVPFRKYVEVSTNTPQRKEYKTPYIEGYNVHFSERRAESHTKKQFIEVYCSGTKNSNGMDCYNDEYAITFVDVANWSYGVLKAPIKAKRHGRKPILFLMVHNIGVDAEYMSDAKRWSETTKLPIIFATIDTYIPVDWVM